MVLVYRLESGTMPPKRKAELVPDEPLPTKRLRSRTRPLSTPTKFDTPGSRREKLKPSPRKARKDAAEPGPSATINELEDISNTAPEVIQECRTPRRKARTVPEPSASGKLLTLYTRAFTDICPLQSSRSRITSPKY